MSKENHGYMIKLDQEMFFDNWEDAQQFIGAMTKGQPVQPMAEREAFRVSDADVSIQQGYFDIQGKADD